MLHFFSYNTVENVAINVRNKINVSLCIKFYGTSGGKACPAPPENHSGTIIQPIIASWLSSVQLLSYYFQSGHEDGSSDIALVQHDATPEVDETALSHSLGQ